MLQKVANSLPIDHHQKRSLRFKFADAFGGRTRWGAHNGPPDPLAGSVETGEGPQGKGRGKGGRWREGIREVRGICIPSHGKSPAGAHGRAVVSDARVFVLC